MTPRINILLVLIAACASQQAHASWAIDCMLEGRVASAPKHEFSKQQRTHFVVFQFEVTKADALKDNYVARDCAGRVGKAFKAEVVSKQKSVPQFTIGDRVRLRYRLFEQQCVGGGACSSDWYEYVPFQ